MSPAERTTNSNRSRDSSVFTLHQGNSLHLERIAEEEIRGSSEIVDRDWPEFIDATITSPPYGDIIQYGDTNSEENVLEDQIGFGDTYEDYRNHLRDIFRTTYAYTREGGSLWIVVNTYRDNGVFVNLPNDIVKLCQNLEDRETCPSCQNDRLNFDNKRQRPVCPECGWETIKESWNHHDTIIWDKIRARPWAPEGGFRNVFEYILVLKKGEVLRHDTDRVRIADTNEFSHWWVDWPERYNPRGKVPSNIWQAVTPSQGAWGDGSRDHPAPFPPDLINRIVRFTTEPGDVVFDPFAGTGTTVAQANILGRNGFGIELSEKYVDMYDTLREKLANNWKDEQEQGELLEQQQQRLAHVVWGLREIVYAKKLALKLRRDLGSPSVKELGLNTLFTVSDPLELEEGQYAPESRSLQVIAVTESNDQATRYGELLPQYKNEAPWNGFEINAEVEVVTRSDAVPTVEKYIDSDSERLYFYPKSRHYQFERTLSLDDWERKSAGTKWYSNYAAIGCPPIISTNRIDIDRSGEVPEVNYDPLGEPPESITSTNDYHESLNWGATQTNLDSFLS